MIARLAIVFLLVTFVGCNSGPEKPGNLIPEDKYTSLMVEMQLARSYEENADVDTATVDSLISEIYEKYDVTASQFKKTHNYYQHFPEKQKSRAAEAIEKLKMELVTEDDSTATDESPTNIN